MKAVLSIIGLIACLALWGSWQPHTAQGAAAQAETVTVVPSPNSGGFVPTVPPTNTPRPTHTPEPTLIASPTSPDGISTDDSTSAATSAALSGPLTARMCHDCDRVRLRKTPGTTGDVVDFLDSLAQFSVIGRTDPADWLQVIVKESGEKGWIAAQFVKRMNLQDFDSDTLAALPVTGVSVEASATPTPEGGVLAAASGSSIPGWLTGIDAHTHEIFLKGQSLGNRADVFSRVGDSITVSPYFLYPFGQGNYDLGAYGYLSGVIGYFSKDSARAGNSFVNTPLAAGKGWSTVQILQPGYSNKPLCGNDTPLVCEYKLVKPAVALIMIGTNDSGSGAPGWFQGQLSQIVQTSLDMGVIPVLSTIPPKTIDNDQTQRVNAFNQVIRAVATQYDVPLWDYYSAMSGLPNQGISSDGLHPSYPLDGSAGHLTPDNLQYGYTVRNLMALQVLDALWHNVLS